MSFIYHQIPPDMQGTVLYPLNTLKDVYPELYGAKSQKYVGREYMLEQIIPILDCKWNDVLFLSPVHPREISKAYQEIGQSFAGRRYVEVKAEDLEPENTLFFLYQHRRKVDDMNLENFAAYDPKRVEEFAELPQETKDYYKEKFAAGEKPLLWHRVPHILYRGTIDISDKSIIVTD